MENKIYLQYKSIKQRINSVSIPYFTGYSMGSVISMSLYHLIKNYEKSSYCRKIWDCFIRIIIVFCFDTYELKYDKKNPNSKILFMYSVSDPSRKDLQRLFDNLYNLYPNEDKITFVGKANKQFVGFKFGNLGKLVRIYKSLKDLNNVYFRFMTSLFILQSYELKNLESHIEIKNYKIFITFSDVFEQDNFLVQTFKMKSIPTVSMQHGQAYCKKGYENNDDLEYENFISDYKLSWGKQTMDEMIKGGVNKQRIINVGSPKYIGKERQVIKREKKDIFGVVLNNAQNIEANKEMIILANKLCDSLNLRYSIKVHPADDISNYKDVILSQYFVACYKHEDIEQYLSSVYLSIVNYSSIYMELLYFYHPTLLYRNKLNERVFDENFNTFNNYNELTVLVKDFIINYDIYSPLIEELSHYFIEDDFENNVKIFISSLANVNSRNEDRGK